MHLRQTPGDAGSSYADFDLAYDHINSYEQGSSGGMYTVQSGDTLSGIASNLWGDASLWYKQADVSGLAGDAGLLDASKIRIYSKHRNEISSRYRGAERPCA